MRKAILIAAFASARAQGAPPWNDAAAKDLEAFARQTFQAWQSGDLDAIRASIAADGALGAFDTDMTGKPVTIHNLDEQMQYAERMFDEMKKMGAKVTFDIHALNCRATETAGVCAIEYDGASVMADGSKQVWPVRATLVARLGSDGWKATHWHASPARAPEAPEPVDLGPGPIPALNIDPKTLNWQPVPGMNGLKTAVVWENPVTHGSVSFVQFPKKFEFGPHYHAANSHNVVIKGSIAVTGADGLTEEAKAGGWTLIPAKWIHSTASKKGATVLTITDGPEAIVPVDAKGNPLPAGAASAPPK
jgi:quercetin dioxygenase-like cupin family protein/ketosteroid isomerase-like protein